MLLKYERFVPITVTKKMMPEILDKVDIESREVMDAIDKLYISMATSAIFKEDSKTIKQTLLNLVKDNISMFDTTIDPKTLNKELREYRQQLFLNVIKKYNIK